MQLSAEAAFQDKPSTPKGGGSVAGNHSRGRILADEDHAHELVVSAKRARTTQNLLLVLHQLNSTQVHVWTTSSVVCRREGGATF